MKQIFKLLAIIFACVFGAAGIGIGILYLTGGFNPVIVEPTNISFVTDNIMTSGPIDLKVMTTTEDVTERNLTLSVYPSGIVSIPVSNVQIGQEFVVWPVKAADGQNVGGKVEVTASFAGKLVAKCNLFIDVEVQEIQVELENTALKWGETLSFSTKVFPARAINPNELTAGTKWAGIGSKNIYYYLIDESGTAVDSKYAEFMIGSTTVGSMITNAQIEEAKAAGKGVCIKTKSDAATSASNFYVKAYCYSTYNEEAKYLELPRSEQLSYMIIDKNSNPDDVDNYRTDNHFAVSNFEINKMESVLKSNDPANLKTVEIYLYQTTVFVADMKQKTPDDSTKDLDISLGTDTAEADTSIIDFYIRDNVKLSLSDTSYFSFGSGEVPAHNGGETTDYWTWTLNWNTPDSMNYRALGKEFVVNVKYSEDIQFSFKIKVVNRPTTKIEYITNIEGQDYFSVKRATELALNNDGYYTVSPESATFKGVKIYFTSLRNTIKVIPDTAGVYKASFVINKTEDKAISVAAVYAANEDALATVKYLDANGIEIADLESHVGLVRIELEYTRGATNTFSGVPINVSYTVSGATIETQNMKFYPSLAGGGFSSTPFLKVNGIEVVTDFDVQTDYSTGNTYVNVKANNAKITPMNIGTITATAQVVYTNKDGISVTDEYGNFIWTDVSVSYDIEIYDEVTELGFFDLNPITDTEAGNDGVSGTKLATTPDLISEAYVLEENKAYYVYFTSDSIEALSLAIEDIDRTSISISPYYSATHTGAAYYSQLVGKNQDAVTYSWEKSVVGSTTGYKIRFFLNNVYKVKVNGEFLDIIYKITIRVDNCVLEGYFTVVDNIIESAEIMYDTNSIKGTKQEGYVTGGASGYIFKDLNAAQDFDFDKFNFLLKMEDGSTTTSTIRYTIENTSETVEGRNVDIHGLVGITNGKLFVKNMPYVDGGVKLTITITSEGLTGMNSYYELVGNNFVLSKADITASFDFVVYGLNITVSEIATESVKGIKLNVISLLERLAFAITDANSQTLQLEDVGGISNIIDFIIYGGNANGAFGIEDSIITILDDIDDTNTLLIRLFIGENLVLIGEQTSHTISIDSVFSVSANPGTTEIDAPNSVLLTDTVVNIVKSVTDVTTEDISDYDTFLVEYVLDEEQANYETLAKYVSFRVDGNETYINVSTIPQDYDAVIKVVVYGDMYDKYTITYNGVEYTYVEGFFDTNGKEFPVGGYEIVDLESGTGKITFRAKSGSPARELASISTEYRVEYNGLTYIYDNSVTKFMYNGVELPLRSYAADFIELELKHKSSEIVVDSKFTVEYDGKIYTYNPDFSQFLNNETDLPVVYYVVDWANSNVNLYDRTLNVQYDGTLKTFKVSYGNEYFYDAARKDFYYGANKLSEDIEGGYYWDNSPANYGLLYYKGTELAIATEYSLKYEGNTYIYDGTNFVYDSQTLFEGNYDWDTAKGIVYYVGEEDVLTIGRYHIAEYLETKYSYKKGFFNNAGEELETKIGEYELSADKELLTYDGGEIAVNKTVEKEEKAVSKITLTLRNIYSDSNLSIGEKYYKTVDLQNFAYEFEFEDVKYFYNPETEQFMDIDGNIFEHEIVNWEGNEITYIDEENVTHRLLVSVSGGTISITHNGVVYNYEDKFVTFEENSFPYEISKVVDADGGYKVALYKEPTIEIPVQFDAANTRYYIQYGTPSVTYFYDDTNTEEIVFKTDDPVPVVFPHAILSVVTNNASVLEKVICIDTSLPVYDDAGTIKMDYNGMTFVYNPGSGKFFYNSQYVFGLSLDTTNIGSGYVNVTGESIGLGFVFLFQDGSEYKATLNGVEFTYTHNFYNKLNATEKFYEIDTINFTTNKVTFVGLTGTTIDIVKDGENFTITYGGKTYIYRHELVVDAGMPFPEEITTVDITDAEALLPDAAGKLNATYDIYYDSTKQAYYVDYIVIDEISIRFYYRKVFVSQDVFNAEFPYEIDMTLSEFEDGKYLYYINDADDTHFLTLSSKTLPKVKYFVEYDYGYGPTKFYYNGEGDFIYEVGPVALSTYINISEYSLIGGYINGVQRTDTSDYNGQIQIEHEDYVEDFYVVYENDRYYYVADHEGSPAFIKEGAVTPTSDDIFRIESITGSQLRYYLASSPAEKFNATIIKEATFDVTAHAVTVSGQRYVYDTVLQTFVKAIDGSAFPYTIQSIDMVRKVLKYNNTMTADIVVCTPNSFTTYEGKVYYLFEGLGVPVMLQRDIHNRFPYEFDLSSVDTTLSKVGYVKYDNHILAGKDNGVSLAFDNLYSVVVEGIRYFYKENGDTFVGANGEEFPHTINFINWDEYTLTYSDDVVTKIYGQYDSYTVTFEDVEGADTTSNATVDKHMRYDSANNKIYSYDLNCDKEIYVVVTINFADGGKTVIKKRVVIVQNLFMSMVDGATFNVSSNPVGLNLTTNDSLYTNKIYRVNQNGDKTYLNIQDYIEYDPVNVPTNTFAVASQYSNVVKISYHEEEPFLSLVGASLGSTTKQVTVLYNYCVTTNNGYYYLQYEFDILLIQA